MLAITCIAQVKVELSEHANELPLSTRHEHARDEPGQTRVSNHLYYVKLLRQLTNSNVI